MAQAPEKSRTAKGGSNVKAHKALLEHDARAREKRLEALLPLRKKIAREQKAFLTRNVRRVVEDVRRSSRDAFTLALLKAKGDGAAIIRARRAARIAKDRALAERIPGFAAFRAAQVANAGTYQTLITQLRAADFDPHVDLGPGSVASPDTPFKAPPFDLFDLRTHGVRNFVTDDRSAADPVLGIVINQLTWHNDEHSSIFGGGNTLDAESSAAVGMDYTVPQSGRVRCSAIVQNIYNYVTYSLTDNWGWSDGEVHFLISLFVRITRGPLLLAAFSRLIFEGGLIALHGTDLHGVSFDDIDTTTPFTLSAKTQKIFDKGEKLQLLVGSHLQIGDTLNDMEARVNGTLGWQVKEIAARVT